MNRPEKAQALIERLSNQDWVTDCRLVLAIYHITAGSRPEVVPSVVWKFIKNTQAATGDPLTPSARFWAFLMSLDGFWYHSFRAGMGLSQALDFGHYRLNDDGSLTLLRSSTVPGCTNPPTATVSIQHAFTLRKFQIAKTMAAAIEEGAE